MDCKDTEKYLIEAAMGGVAEPDFHAHVCDCAMCAARVQEMQRTMALLDEWQAPEPSAYFDTRLKARLREEMAHSHGWLSWFRKPALAAAMTGLLVVGGALFTTGGRNAAPQLPSAAVQDLQDLDKNHDLFADFELLDDVSLDQNVQQDANP
jgi:hypothetical protein